MEVSLVSKLQAEALDLLEAKRAYWPLALAVFKSTALRASGLSMSFTSRRKDFVQLLLTILEEHGESDFSLVRGRQVQRINWDQPAGLNRLRGQIRDFLDQVQKLGVENWALENLGPDPELEENCRQTLLCMLYLSIGSFAEPNDSYHLELAFPRVLPGRIMGQLISHYGLNFKELDRQSARLLYLKDGQELADFMLLAGCSSTYLDYEQLRVEKDINNQVNRVVNCDSANAGRMAEAAARQFQAINKIIELKGLTYLPPKLRETAEARLKYPGLSLGELAGKLKPAIGKSGLNHRLKKIEQIAAELES